MASVMTRLKLFRARLYAMTFVALISVGVGIMLRYDREGELDHAEILTASMSQAVGQQIDGSLRSIEGLLEEMAEAVLSNRWGSPSQRDRFAARVAAYPELLYLGRISRDGILHSDTIPSLGVGPDGTDVSERDYFRRHRQSPSSRAMVGQPITGQLTKERTITLSRSVIDRDGIFQGVVLASISSDYYARILDSNMLDPEGGTAVISLDGDILARAPAQEEKFGMNIANSDLFRIHIPHQSTGMARLQSKADNNLKIIGYRVLDRFRLVVTSGISEFKALESWRQRSTAVLTATLFLMILIIYWAWVADHREIVLLRHQEMLEDKIMQRTAMLSETTSVAEQRAARLEAINDKITRLAQIAAHHLQEPLRPMVSFSQLARRNLRDDQGEIDNYLAYVERGGIRLKSVLLAFQRYTELLGHDPDWHAVDLNALVGGVQNRLSDDIAAAQASIIVEPLPVIRGDAAMLDCALSELISNALTYRHPTRSPQIVISGERDANYWTVRVADNGPGIPANLGRQIFQAFARHHSDRPDSIGLGLAMCLAIAEAHGGTIDLQTSPDGSTLTLIAPMLAVKE